MSAMKIESMLTDVDGLGDRGRRAARVLVTHATRARYPNGADALHADAIAPPPPLTREAATPHILFVGPFQDEADLIAVAIFVGIGFLEIRNVDGALHSYAISPIDGEGMALRTEFLSVALQLYFNDVTFRSFEA